MIVYCNSIWFESTSLDTILSTIAYWIQIKTKSPVYPDTFLNQSSRSFKNGTTLDIVKVNEDYPLLYSFRYQEQDEVISGRRWIVEIGIRQDSTDTDIQCSILVQTSEISVNIPQPKIASRPWLVNELLKKGKPSRRTAGTTIKTLDTLDDVEAMVYEIEAFERRYPIILVSPTSEGKYLVNIERLFRFVNGLAQIVPIPVGLDSFEVTNILTKPLSAFNGAVNLIYPPVQRSGSTNIPRHVLLASELEEWTTDKRDVELEILTKISYRVNLPYSWMHISPDIVKEFQRKRELAKLRQKYLDGGDLKIYLQALEEQNRLDARTFQGQIEALQAENEYYLGEFERADEERRKALNKADGLSAQLEALKNARNQRNENEDCSAVVRNLLETYFCEGLSPYQSLELITRLFPDRIIVLDSAYKAAEDSSMFYERKVPFELMRKLATGYWQALADGKGDNEARQVFGKDEFASKESETGEGNKNTRRRRTFEYKGAEYEMMKHLKFGVKDSRAETLRIHFEWLADEKKIIIGYCGAHLDFG